MKESQETQLAGLVTGLIAEFEQVKSKRRVYEDRWLEDLRQYKGVYSPQILKNIPSNRSKAFIRLTKVKVDTLCARIMDTLFPSNGEKNWGIKPSTNPQVHPELLNRYVLSLVQQGENPDEIDMREVEEELAKKACEEMEKVIEDQLSDNNLKMDYYETSKNVVLSALKFGTGVLKGVLTDTREDKRYIVSSDGTFTLALINREPTPYYEFVPIWNVYPDMNVTEISDANFVWQTHVMSKKDLLELAKRQDFRTKEIIEYINSAPDGDYSLMSYEADLFSIADEETEVNIPDMKGKYLVLERWGYLEGKDLQMAGVDIPEDRVDEIIFPANIWILGNRIIKAVLNPIDGVDIPFFFYYYEKDETSIFGEGLPTITRHPQRILNSAVRALLDNASITTGPQIGVDIRRLVGDEDPTDVYPFKVWLFDNVDDIRKVFSMQYMASYTTEFMNIIKFFYDFLDEVSTPRFMHGDPKVSGSAKTATGLSMLMASANINIKNLVRSFDNRITKPFIKAMYYWNMKFNPRVDIKGDYEVIALGTASLMAKEVQAQRMLEAVNITNNPRFQGRVDDGKLLAEIMKVLELPDHILRTEKEYEQWQKKQLVLQAMAQKEAEVQAILKEAEKRGINVEEMLKQLLANLILNQQQQMRGEIEGGQ